jgi:hypothetical protein
MNKTLSLTADDVELLGDVIRVYLDDLRSEIGHTDNFDYREGLHAKEQRLNALLEQLAGS